MAQPLIKVENHNQKPSHTMGFFSNNEGAGFFEWFDWAPEKELEMLVFRVARKPKFLEAHVERIYHCLAYGLNQPLFGALVDLLIILNGRGQDLVNRVFEKARPGLNTDEFQALSDFFSTQNSTQELNSPYSIFSKGFQQGRSVLQIKSI